MENVTIDTLNIEIQEYLGGIKNCKPQKKITLYQMLEKIDNPPEDILKLLSEIREAKEVNNIELTHKLKEQLPYYVPPVTIKDWRSYNGIESFTGLLTLDFDELTEKEAVNLKYDLVENNPFVISSWLSASKKGVHAIVLTDKAKDVEDFKALYDGIVNYKFANVGKLKDLRGFDNSMKKPTQPFFISYDNDTRVKNSRLFKWVNRLKEQKAPNHSYIAFKKKYNSDEVEKRLYKMIDTKIDSIVDVGHPNLLGIARAIGGYIAAGYISEIDALSYFDYKINTHSYLMQKAKTYQKTIRDLVKNGKQSPLYLD
jgi:hypothetical protein